MLKVFCYLCLVLVSSASYQDSESLFNNFFGKTATYNPKLRPVRDVSDAVNVTTSIGLRQIIRLEDQSQVMSASVWVRIYWKDELLVWNPDDHNGLEWLDVPHELVWRPDLVLYSSVSERYGPSFDHSIISIYYTGNILYMYPVRLEVSCPLDITFFPFDEQHCDLLLGSWSHDGSKMNLSQREENAVDIEVYQENSEWELLNFSVKRNEKTYSCCPDVVFPNIAYTVYIRRRWVSLFFYMIIPMILIQFLALMQFLLPCDSGEKVTLGITVYLSMIVYLLMVQEMLPNSETVPLIVKFIIATMALISISQIAGVLVLCIHHNGIHDNHGMVPHWARILFLHWIAFILGMSRYITGDEEHNTKLLATSQEVIEVIPEENEEENWVLDNKPSASHSQRVLPSANSYVQSQMNVPAQKDAGHKSVIQDFESTGESSVVDHSSSTGSIKTNMVFGSIPVIEETLTAKEGEEVDKLLEVVSKKANQQETSVSVESLHSFNMQSKPESPSICEADEELREKNETNEDPVGSVVFNGPSQHPCSRSFLGEELSTSSLLRREVSGSSQLSGSRTSMPRRTSWSPGSDANLTTTTTFESSLRSAHILDKDKLDGIVTAKSHQRIESQRSFENINENNNITQPQLRDSSFSTNNHHSVAQDPEDNKTSSGTPWYRRMYGSLNSWGQQVYGWGGRQVNRCGQQMNSWGQQVRERVLRHHKTMPEEDDVNTIAKQKFSDYCRRTDSASTHRDSRRKSVQIREADLKKDQNLLLFKIYKHCEDYKERIMDNNRDSEVKCEWQQVAMVLDRLMFFIYCFCNFVLLLWFFTQIPRY